MPDQSENVTIKAINGRSVTLDRPLNFTHWGVGTQRAEVGYSKQLIMIICDYYY